MNDLPWAKPFGRRCKARLRKTPDRWRWGRCELVPHDKDCDHALETGLENVRWSEPEEYRELTDVGVLILKRLKRHKKESD